VRTLLIACVLSGAAFAQSYTVSVILPPSGFAISYVGGINNSGQVTGAVSNGTSLRAFIGSPSGSTLVSLPAGWASAEGNAINNLGQVAGEVGHGIDPSTDELSAGQAFIGTGSGASVIPLPSGWATAQGVAINDAGQVAGSVCNNACAHSQAFVGTPLGVALIPNPSGPVGFTRGVAINSSGQVAGFAIPPYQAFIGTVESATLIPQPGPAYSTNATGINDFGVTIGNATAFSTSGGFGFIGTQSGITFIPPISVGFNSSGASAINDSGVVIGTSEYGGAWVWSASTGIQVLSSMVPSGWSISSGISLSQNGRILATGSLNGSAYQYLELIPVGLPATPAPR
jgi:hypothetical protein